jgi:hypothetical protein
MFGKNLKIPVNQLSINMTINFIDCTNKIPELKNSEKMTENAWIAPNGDFYGMEGAKHHITAIYIAVFVLGKDETVLNHGTYFRDSFESYLLKNGWICLKNTSWFTGNSDISTFRMHHELTEKQKTVLFDYSEYFGFNYEKLLSDD